MTTIVEDRLLAHVGRSADRFHSGARAEADEASVAHDTETRRETRSQLFELVGDPAALERVIGTNDLLPASFLERGARTARAIARIEVRGPTGDLRGHGTGFLIGDDLLMTNHHVLASAAEARRSLATFDYEDDVDGTPKPAVTFRLAPEQAFCADEALDYAIVAVQPSSLDGKPLARYGFCPLLSPSGKALETEWVNIIQHPRGNSKQVTIRENQISKTRGADFIHYLADTDPGSSGAPVFNDQWLVVALHHAGVPARPTGGPLDSLTGVKWVANEGVRISSIAAHLAKRGDLTAPVAERVLAVFRPLEAFAADPELGLAESPSADAVATPAVVGVEDPNRLEAERRAMRIAVARERADRERAFQAELDQDLADAELESWRRPIRILAEGDSWFHYPLVLGTRGDVIDHVRREVGDARVLNLAHYGDEAVDMLSLSSRQRLREKLANDRYDFNALLFSGGGNDIVGDRLIYWVRPRASGLPPEQALDLARFDSALDLVEQAYLDLIRLRDEVRPGCTIFVHQYDFAIPDGRGICGLGPWLRPVLVRRGWREIDERRTIVRALLQRFAARLDAVAERSPNVIVVRTQGTLGASDWHNELHPNRRGFERIASKFADAIRAWRSGLQLPGPP